RPTIGIAGSGASQNLAQQVTARVADAATVGTDKNLTVNAADVTAVSMIVGAEASGTTAGVGLSVANTNIDRTVSASLGDATISAKGAVGTITTAPQGIVVQATTDEHLLSYSAGHAAANDLGVAASLVFNRITSTTDAAIDPGATVTALNPD